MAEADHDQQKQQILNDMDKHEKRKQGYRKLENELDKSSETQISTSDPDSRQIVTRNNITEVAYSVQTTVDAKHLCTSAKNGRLIERNV